MKNSIVMLCFFFVSYSSDHFVVITLSRIKNSIVMLCFFFFLVSYSSDDFVVITLSRMKNNIVMLCFFFFFLSHIHLILILAERILPSPTCSKYLTAACSSQLYFSD
jgi:hypothetical protein